MKRRLLYSIAISLFLTSSVCGQWVQTSTVPTAQVRSISMNGSNILVGSMTGWAFGPSGGVYYSTNGGTTFTKTTVTPNTRVWSVMLAGTNFLVGSDGGGIHLSTNNGTTWTNPLPGKSVRAFASDGSGNLYAAGYPDGVWRSTNSGASWTVLGTPNGNLLSITIVGSNIYVGANAGGIYRSNNGGTTWTQPLTANTNVWSFATIGSTIFANTTTGLYSSTDDGLTWAMVNNPGSSWQACPMVAVGTNLLVGTSTGVKLSTDMGVTWTVVNTGLTVEVAGLAADNQYAYAGSGGYTLTGSFWRRPLSEMITSLCVNPTIAGVIGSDQQNCGSFDPALIESISPASGVTGAMEYKWQQSVAPFTAWVDIAASNAASYNPGVITQTTQYKRLVRAACMTTWTNAPESNTITMTVHGLPQLQMTMNGIDVAANNDGTVDTGSFNVCSAENNVTITALNDANSASGHIKVITTVDQTNVNSTFADATGLLSNYTIPATQSVQLIDASQPGTLVASFQLFNDLNNDNILDAGECAGDAIVYTITVNPILTASVSVTASANNVCEGTEVTFTPAPVNGGDAPTYEWFVKNVSVATGRTYSYAPADGDIITVVMTSNATPCLAESTVTSPEVVMVVNPLVTPTVTIVASSNPACAGSTVVFTATPTNGGIDPVYVWKVNTEMVGTNANTYSYSPAHGDVVTCEMTPDATITCPEISPAISTAITMVVNPTQASVSIVSDLNTVCEGTSVTFTATPVNGGDTPFYQWKVDNVDTGTNSATFSYVPAINDVVTCEMTSNAPCVEALPVASNQVAITVNPILTARVTISASANNVCEGTEVTFTPTPVEGGSAPTYQWYVDNVLVGSGSNYSYVPLNDDIVSVVMTSNSTNCLASMTATSDPITMVVNPRPQLMVTINNAAVTANNDGVDDTQALVVCNSKTKNLFFEYAETKGITPSTLVKVNAKYTLSNVIVALRDGVFSLSAPITGSTNVRLSNTALPGTLVMSFQAFVDVNNNNLLDASECPGDWIVFTISIAPALQSAGPISGPVSVPRGSNQTYSVSPVANATSYVWTYSGTGVTINNPIDPLAGHTVTIDFASNATPGTLSARAANDCGLGPVSILKLRMTKSGQIALDPVTASEEVIPMKVYPVRNIEIRMEGTVNLGAMATLYDNVGRVVMTRELEEGNLNILPLHGIKTAVYVLSINDNGKIQTFKVPVAE